MDNPNLRTFRRRGEKWTVVPSFCAKVSEFKQGEVSLPTERLQRFGKVPGSVGC